MYNVEVFRSTGPQHCSDWLSQWRWGMRWCLKNIPYQIYESYSSYKSVFTNTFIAKALNNWLTYNQNLFDQDIAEPTRHLYLYVWCDNLLFKGNNKPGFLFCLWAFEISKSLSISWYGQQMFKKHWRIWLIRLLSCLWNWKVISYSI